MKTASCPICSGNIFSETFRVGEIFPCPNCHYELIVEPYEDKPIVKTAFQFGENMNWAQTLWRDGKLVLRNEQIQALGEFVITTFNLRNWEKESKEKLEKILDEIKNELKIIRANHPLKPVLLLYMTLLDIFLNSEKK